MKANHKHSFLIALLICIGCAWACGKTVQSKIDSLSDLLRNTDKTSERFKLLANLSGEYMNAKDFEKAVHHAKAAKVLMDSNSNHHLQGKVYSNLAFGYAQLGQPDSMQIYVEKHRHLAYASNKAILKCQYQRILCFIAAINGDAKKAVEAAHELLLNAPFIEDTSFRNNYLLIAYSQLASNYGKQGYYTMALKYAIECRKYALLMDDSYNVFLANMNLAATYAAIKRYNKAIESYQLIIENCSNFPNQCFVGFTGIGHILHEQDSFKQAMSWFQKAEDYVSKLKPTLAAQIELRDFYNVKSICLYRLKRFDESLHNNRRSLEITKRFPEEHEKVATHLLLQALNYMSISEGEKMANLLLDSALSYLPTVKRLSIQLVNYKYLTELYDMKGDFNESLKYARLYSTIVDSIYSKENARMRASLELVHRSNERETQIQLLESKVKMGQEKAQKDRQLILVILTSSLVVLLLIMIILRIQRSRARMQNQIEVDQKQAEIEQLRRLDQLKTEFFTQVAHEIRTPLTLNLGYIKDVYEKLDNADMKNALTKSQQNGEYLLKMVDDLLDIHKIEEQQLQLNMQYGNLMGFVEEITDSFSLKAASKGLSLTFTSSGTEGLMIFDQAKVKKILGNLIDNAIKFSPKGENVSVELGVNHTKKKFTIRVIDHGPGIADELQDQVFKRYYRVADHVHIHGNGLGLYLVKQLVDIQGGRILLDSQLGKGSRFTVSLPFKDVEQMKTTVIPKEDVTAETNWPNIIGEIPVILLVEDNEEMREFVKSIFSKYQLLEAANGKTGLKMATEEIPDIIITDVMMPHMDGMEFSTCVKQNDLTAHIPIVMLTAKVSDDDELQGLNSGADAYVTKPFDKRKLIQVVNNALNHVHKVRNKKAVDNIDHSGSSRKVTYADKFLTRFIQHIDKNLTDHNFDMDKMAEEVHLSHSQLYRKVKAITGYAPTDFLRKRRLEKGRELLERDPELKLIDVATQVGFKSDSYFIRCYKKEFGVTPKSQVV